MNIKQFDHERKEWKLHTENLGGNMHFAAETINRWGWAPYLVTMMSTGHNTIAVFKMPTALVHAIRMENRGYNLPVTHDDWQGGMPSS